MHICNGLVSGGGKAPLLSRGGVAARSKKCGAATIARAGEVVLAKEMDFLTSTTRPLHQRRLRDFFDVAASPPLLRRGASSPPRLTHHADLGGIPFVLVMESEHMGVNK